MHNTARCSSYLIFRAIFGATLLASSSLAADGVREINQARALAGGVTPDDQPGFPVTLSDSGSYLLTGNLTVDEPETTAIEITVSNVRLDLNGFALQGPARCQSGIDGSVNCGPSGDEGDGIKVGAPPGSPPVIGGSIQNGSVSGMGHSGIRVSGFGLTISGVAATQNASIGINHEEGSALTIRDCTVMRNGVEGVTLIRGVASNNTVSLNGGNGIRAQRSNIFENIVSDNRGPGVGPLFDVGDNLVRDNVISNNASPQLDMSLGGSWSGNNLNGTPGSVLVTVPDVSEPGFGGSASPAAHEPYPNTCSGSPCTGFGPGSSGPVL